ncbi:MAG: hypothetical protein NC819_02065 [Candidatus Omnitrophica bacterium]|nr:hypothetical protein [Candidatus Omnitrophota bacterium]
MLWAAPASRCPEFVRTMEVLALIKGIVLLLAPAGRFKAIVGWRDRLPVSAHRLCGIIALAIAAVFLYPA